MLTETLSSSSSISSTFAAVCVIRSTVKRFVVRQIFDCATANPFLERTRIRRFVRTSCFPYPVHERRKLNCRQCLGTIDNENDGIVNADRNIS